jgi:predicted TIM-barrel fold metal-dependent hydrolase
MPIVDSQVHIWSSGMAVVPRAPDEISGAHRAGPFESAELLSEMDQAGVDRVVLVPRIGQSNDLSLTAARSHPDRFGVTGLLPPGEPDPDLVSGWCEQPGMLGLRLTLHQPHQRSWPSDGTMDWVWQAAEQAQVPVMVFAPDHLPALADIAARHPDLRLGIDHLGLGLGVMDDGIGPALAELWPLAALPNVTVKASALPAYVTEDYPFPSLRPHIRRAVDEFGPQRVFWGTDFTRLPCTYRQAVTHFTEQVGLDTEEQRLVMGDAVLTWLGWS